MTTFLPLAPAGAVLSVDRIACTGHGICADWLPEHITLDEWGYPVLHGERVAPELVAAARQAARQCPVRALRLTAARPGRPPAGVLPGRPGTS